ncbi:MAG TPA: DUF1365 domain-containing protein [Nocardioides bacterium]|uniref:FAD-dependent oxidoreductase n=1 Tax=uncultured Nocardioides sp. TaxID=198441 RepID=UPI000EE9F7B3|nr:FAD-dependent oxidoreductase [uncultured Nocardioides sp.]HCB04888.1 DUF1365 domain-containing protein [Nocardioides sp.]HRD61975.1 DUF1365 family protein [Nocardioides sp.]
MTSPAAPRRIAVVGSGVAGLTAAYVASRTAHVTLYEADDRLGGHADTHVVREGDSADERALAIDTGFIVHNPRTYPVLLRLFAELGVATQPSEMSMSIRDDGSGLQWAGALGRRGVFPTLANVVDPRYLRMLTEIPRFHRRARRLLAAEVSTSSTSVDHLTLGEFLAAGRFSAYFRRHFMEPLVSAVWSCDPEAALDYPARYLFTFLQHHGMLGVFGSPQWRTVTGGSQQYVAAVANGLDRVHTGSKVTTVLETADDVEVTDGNGKVEVYDAVVIATHPGQALDLLAAPTAKQREVLSAMPYSRNVALLHTDDSVMPRSTNAWASWNFWRTEDSGRTLVTYDLTRLQRLDTDTHYFVTLVGRDASGEELVDPALVIDRMEYEHPLYNPASVAAQTRLPEIDSDRIGFAGAYHGWGFHEDGAASGLRAVERLGLTWPELRGHAPADDVPTGVFDTTIRHTRRAPFARSFTHRSHTWVVDLDDLPDHGVLGRFEGRDHLGDPGRTIRANVDAFLARHGIDLTGGRVVMAAHARAFGHCFNPISVHWCWNASGRQVATVVEVHNTYGDRHAYLVRPDEQGRASTPKAMYVSPFHGTDGTYRMTVPVPHDDRLDLAVHLTTDDGATFSASLSGRRTTARARRAALAALRGTVLIRMHGIALWLRRLPVHDRPTHTQKGVQP